MTKTEMSLWSNFRHWLHRKLSFWQVPVQLGISAKLPFPWTCFYHVYYLCDVKTPKLLDKFVIFCTTKKLIFHQSAVLSTFQFHPTTINFYYHDLHVNTFMYTFWDWMCWPVLNKDCNIVTPDHAMSWWRHEMETFSALLAICAGNSPVTCEFLAQRPVTRSFDVFFIRVWINVWVNNREAGALRRCSTHYDVTVMITHFIAINQFYLFSLNTASIADTPALMSIK